MFSKVIDEIRQLFGTDKQIPLHAPVFCGHEKKYLNECVDSTFVSSVGAFVGKFERMVSNFTKIPYAVATTNGTSALHMSLLLAGVDRESAVLTQSLSFVATANAIVYCQALPIFIDSDEKNLGMSADSLSSFLEKNCQRNVRGELIHTASGRLIKACVPVHVLGHPCDIQAISAVCGKYGILIIEDCAESLGSTYLHDQHTGKASSMATLSFNGNKIVTTGGGGMILFKDEALAQKAKHLTTTAKVPHAWEFYHDEVGYNYRLPNLNAALGCAQMECLEDFLQRKRSLAQNYQAFFEKEGLQFLKEPPGCYSNYWLNAVILENKKQRDDFLRELNGAQIMSRPLWHLMPTLPAFQESPRTEMTNAQNYVDKIVNIPSGVIL